MIKTITKIDEKFIISNVIEQKEEVTIEEQTRRVNSWRERIKEIEVESSELAKEKYIAEKELSKQEEILCQMLTLLRSIKDKSSQEKIEMKTSEETKVKTLEKMEVKENDTRQRRTKKNTTRSNS